MLKTIGGVFPGMVLCLDITTTCSMPAILPSHGHPGKTSQAEQAESNWKSSSKGSLTGKLPRQDKAANPNLGHWSEGTHDYYNN